MLLSVALGCSEPPERTAAETGRERPSTGQVTVEGFPAPVRLRLYSAPDGLGLPFSTYLPEGIRVEQRASASEQSVQFALDGAGNARGAYLHLFVAPSGATEAAARETVRAVAESYRVPSSETELSPVRLHPWAVVEYPIHSQGTTKEPLRGWVALGRHAGRWFHLILQYPESTRERALPLLQVVLDHWRWSDTGHALVETPAPDTITP